MELQREEYGFTNRKLHKEPEGALSMEEAFPNVEPGKRPCGGRVTVQLRRVKKKTKSGIILVEETKADEKWETTVAKMIQHGPLAYRHRDTMQPWPEGTWVDVGKFCDVPRWGGSRWERPIPGKFDEMGNQEYVTFATFNDAEIIHELTDDPLSYRAFI
jgi:co-chaperonin GroES (HSP10)